MAKIVGDLIMYKSDTTVQEDVGCASKHGSHVRYHIVHYVSSTHPVPVSGVGWAPQVDVYETPQEYVIEADLGGIDPGQVHIEIEGGLVRLTGERPESGLAGMRCYHVLEIERGNFEREIAFPTAVDVSKAEAVFHHGFLILRVPKRDNRFVHGCFSADSMEGLE